MIDILRVVLKVQTMICQSFMQTSNAQWWYMCCSVSSVRFIWYIYSCTQSTFLSLQIRYTTMMIRALHDDVIKCKHFPRYWPFVRGVTRWPVDSPQKGQWRGAFMFSLICAWIKGWVNNRQAGDLRRHQAHYDVIVMWIISLYHLHRAILKKSGGNRFHIEKNIYFSNIELSHIYCYVVCVALIATKVCICKNYYQFNKYFAVIFLPFS